jgi:hypothetical protein
MSGFFVIIEFRQDAIAFNDTALSELPACRVERDLLEQFDVAGTSRFPYRAVLCRDSEVGAGDADALRPEGRIGSLVVAKAGRGLDAIDAITPVTHAKPEIRLLHQEVDMGLDVAVACAATELRTGGNHASTLTGERCCREQFLQRNTRLVLGMTIDKIVKREVGADIAAVGHNAAHVTEVRLKRMKSGAVALADKARKGFTPLMRIEMPRLTLMQRQIYERGKLDVETSDEGGPHRHADQR